jgi:uncharacterized membrane protein YgcG
VRLQVCVSLSCTLPPSLSLLHSRLCSLTRALCGELFVKAVAVRRKEEGGRGKGRGFRGMAVEAGVGREGGGGSGGGKDGVSTHTHIHIHTHK